LVVTKLRTLPALLDAALELTVLLAAVVEADPALVLVLLAAPVGPLAL
jgi:hypothetical protein